jgi:hypothetical protein
MHQIPANWSPLFISGLGTEALRPFRIKTAPKRSTPEDRFRGLSSWAETIPRGRGDRHWTHELK